MEKGNGDMTTGLMCLGCGYITPASDMWWSWIYKPRVRKVPVVYLLCPHCRFIKPVRVNYLIIEHEKPLNQVLND